MGKRQIPKLNTLEKFGIQIVIAVFCLFIFLPFLNVEASEISASSVISLVNKERLANGLGVLVENSLLSKAARDKAGDMIKNDYFAHTSPSGKSPWYWIGQNGYDYKYAGENLAVNFGSAESQHKAWMASATHRKNILNTNYKEIGVAVAKGKVDGETSIITIQLFGTQVAVISRSPESVPTQNEAKVVQGEQSAEAQSILKPAPEGLKISALQPDKINVTKPVCRNGLCYFSEANSTLNSEKNTQEAIAWLTVVLILIFSVTLNTITLTCHHRHNPFIAANTVILLMILTSMVFWKI